MPKRKNNKIVIVDDTKETKIEIKEEEKDTEHTEDETFEEEELLESEMEETDEENELVEFDDDANKTKENFYKYAKKTDDSDDENSDDDFDEIVPQVKSIYIDSKDRTSKPILTLYEEVRIISERAKQLSLGAKPMIKNVDNLSSTEIAELELKHNVTPFTILRPQPNGFIEIWKISELSH